MPSKTQSTHIDTFVKADICRSLSARLQILSDSLVDDKLLDEELTINEPPRRVFYTLNRHDPVQFCDYLFPSEPVKAILQQVNEQLDLSVKVDQIQAKVEEVAEVKAEEEAPKSKVAVRDLSRLYIIGIVAAIIVLLLSILVHFLLM